MSITPGWTTQQIRDFVYEYERRPHGTKQALLEERGVSAGQLRRWQDTVFEGNLEEGLVPRAEREKLSLEVRRQIARHDTVLLVQIEKLETEVRELKEVNEALGKAIGLLHKLSEQEPGTCPTDALYYSSPPRMSW